MMLQLYRPAAPIHWDWLSIRGPDAEDFLHRLTTVHVRALKPREAAPGFFLSPLGKIRAYFSISKLEADAFFLEYDPGAAGKWKQELMGVIDQFHFGEKFSLETAPGHHPERVCAWVLGELTKAPSSELLHLKHGELEFGSPWSTLWGTREALDAFLQSLVALEGAREISFEMIERMRLAKIRPRMDAELSSDTNPLEAGLSDAISENKGCYPGQEVIEKIISLGSPARRLSLLAGKGPAPSTGHSVFAEGGEELGKITSAISTEEGFEALGFIRRTHAREGVTVHIGAGDGPVATITKVSSFKPGPEK